jgi:hypothetical protein
MLNPQSSAICISINNAQLEHIIAALKIYAPNHTETKFDTNTVFYASPNDTLKMLEDILQNPDPKAKVYGLCL